ncbi:MAG: hypothetical protein PHW95_04305, partial [Patescibacteria group bacterium]|nr:hypothetical protein [Patescibacteria group bacterium]
VVDSRTVLVNLDLTPRSPNQGAVAGESRSKAKGWVELRLGRDGFLRVNGRKVILYLGEDQRVARIWGYEVLGGLENRQVLHPNLRDALLECPHLVPSSWHGWVYFWGVVFSVGTQEYVSGLEITNSPAGREVSATEREYRNCSWNEKAPAAILED